MENFWQTLLAVIGTGTAIITIVAWVVKSIINHFLSRDIQAYKNKLKIESEFEIEKFKNNLRVASIEHEIRFSKLHEKQAIIIAELYSRINIAVKSVNHLLSPLGFSLSSIGGIDRTDVAKKTIEHVTDFLDYYEKHKFYLNDKLCKLMEVFVEEIRIPTFEYSIALTSPKSNDENENRNTSEIWRECWNRVEEKIEPTKIALEKEFKKILGVENLNTVDTTNEDK